MFTNEYYIVGSDKVIDTVLNEYIGKIMKIKSKTEVRTLET